MTETSLGRVAFDEWRSYSGGYPIVTWERQPENVRQAWEFAARAVVVNAPNWPKCPDGCGCRMGTDDADAKECGCDGPCTMECAENGYPDKPSYRDLAVRHEMDERDKARESAAILARLVQQNAFLMEAARIEMRQNGPDAAMRWILNGLPDQWDGEPGTEWDGTESANEWFDRVSEGRKGTGGGA